MSENGMECTTGVGRIVGGHPSKPRPKKHQDGPQKGQPVLDDQGKQVHEIWFAVAFPKEEFGRDIWPTMAAEIATGYPQGVPPRFSYKYDDGDGVDSKGKPFSEREGYAGCFVLSCTQRVNEMFGPPPIFKLNGGKYDQLTGDQIKCGDYVSVGLNLKVNVATGTFTPSIYVNPRAIELVAFGAEIVTAGAVDAATVFGGRQHALPPGATATPTMNPNAPTMPGMGAAPPAAPGMMPGMPAAPAAPVPAPAPPPPPVAGPARPVDPTHIHAAGTPQEQWFINGAWTPAPAQAAVPAPLPPPAPDFTANAGFAAPAAPAMPGMPGMMPPR